MKIDKTVKRETLVILFGMLILSALEQSVFLIIRKWDLTVLFANLLTGGTMVLNFFLMGLTVQKALEHTSEDAKKMMKASQSLRFLMLIVVLAVGAVLPRAFELFALLPPLLFNRITITVHKLALAKKEIANKTEDIEKEDGTNETKV